MTGDKPIRAGNVCISDIAATWHCQPEEQGPGSWVDSAALFRRKVSEQSSSLGSVAELGVGQDSWDNTLPTEL